MQKGNWFVLGVLLFFGAGTAWAQFTVMPIALDGDSVNLLNGSGLITSFSNVDVNNNGEWFAEVDTDYANADEDGALLRGFQLNPWLSWAKENEALVTPAGAMLNTFDSTPLNNIGQASFNFFLSGTTGSGDDSGIYFNKNLLIQESNISSAPQFPGPTPYVGFFDTKINDSNQIIVTASVDIPGVGTTVDRALVRIDNPGGVFTETVLVQENDQLVPGRFVTDLGTGPHETAINNNGNVLYAADLDGDTTTNDIIMLNSTVIAQENDPSPIAGRLWATLTGPELDLNNAGDWVFSGSLDGDSASNLLIEKNGAKFMQEGDTLADIGGVFTFTSFGSGPILIDDDGDVLWFGDWNDPDTTRDTGLFLNDQLIVQEGVTTVNVGGDDVILKAVSGISEAYAMSDNGEWIIFRGQLIDGRDGSFVIYIPEPGSLLLLLGGAACVLRRRR